MSSTLAPPIPFDAWQPFAGAVGDYRESHDTLGNLAEQIFDELNKRRRELESQEARLRHDVEQSEQQLRQRLHELELANQRDAMALEQAQASLLAAADQDTGRADVQAELAATQAELAALREQLAAAGEPAEALRQQLKDAEHERRSLEMELENVRARAVELSDNLAAQKRQAAEDRTHWSSELKEMRRLLERQAELIGQREARPNGGPANAATANAGGAAAAASRTPQRGGPSPATAKPTPKADDAVLGSVMAQFENLQKDRLRRRSNPSS